MEIVASVEYFYQKNRFRREPDQAMTRPVASARPAWLVITGILIHAIETNILP
jgi:hypothetical protein